MYNEDGKQSQKYIEIGIASNFYSFVLVRVNIEVKKMRTTSVTSEICEGKKPKLHLNYLRTLLQGIIRKTACSAYK